MALQVEFSSRGIAQAALVAVERALGYPIERSSSRASKKGRGKPVSVETGYALLCVSPDGLSFGFVMQPDDHAALAAELGLPPLASRNERWLGVDAESAE